MYQEPLTDNLAKPKAKYVLPVLGVKSKKEKDSWGSKAIRSEIALFIIELEKTAILKKRLSPSMAMWRQVFHHKFFFLFSTCIFPS